MLVLPELPCLTFRIWSSYSERFVQAFFLVCLRVLFVCLFVFLSIIRENVLYLTTAQLSEDTVISSGVIYFVDFVCLLIVFFFFLFPSMFLIYLFSNARTKIKTT